MPKRKRNPTSAALAKYVAILKEMAKRSLLEQIQALNADRAANGFKCFLAYMQGHNKQGKEWSLTDGHLIINPPLPVSKERRDEIHQHFNTTLTSVNWDYQQPLPEEEIEYFLRKQNIPPVIENGLEIGVKVLGKNGENPAADPVIFLQTKQGVQVLTIVRKTGEKAFPGGMVEMKDGEIVRDAIVETFVSELLEESFSGDFFRQGHATQKQLDSQYGKNDVTQQEFKNKIAAKLEAMIADANKKVKAGDQKIITDAHKKVVLAALNNSTSQSPSAVLEAALLALTRKDNNDLSKQETLQQTATHMRVELYKEVMKKEYKKFRKIVDKSIKIGKKRRNADPRSTERGYMTMQPVRLVINEAKLKKLKKQCGGLEITDTSHGDDAKGANFIDINEFVVGITLKDGTKKLPYAGHGSVAYAELAEAIEAGELEDAPALRQQLETITKGFTSTEQLQVEELTEKYRTQMAELDPQPAENKTNRENRIKAALKNAAQKGDLEFIDLLIVLIKKDIKHPQKLMEELLVQGAKDGNVSIMNKAYVAGARGVNNQDVAERTPLYYAAMNGHGEAVKFLMSWGAKLSGDLFQETPFHIAAKNGREEVVQHFLQHPNVTTKMLNQRDKNGKTALHYAIENGHPAVVSALLAALEKIEVNRRVKFAERPGKRGPVKPSLNVELHLAIAKFQRAKTDEERGNYLKIVKALVADPRIDLNRVNRYGETPLECALDGEHRQGVEDLVKAILESSKTAQYKYGEQVIALAKNHYEKGSDMDKPRLITLLKDKFQPEKTEREEYAERIRNMSPAMQRKMRDAEARYTNSQRRFRG